MKGDFSRLRFDPTRNYTSVLSQQGRVQLDSDANEQRAIDEYLRATALTDIIGQTGTPRDDAGFAISTDGSAITIGAGRYYVDGLLCEARQPLDYMAQPYLIDPAPDATTLLTGLRQNPTGSVRVWLEAWQRLATPVDDPGIQDVALGEADTTDRLQTVWRVVAEAVPGASVDLAATARATDTLRQSLTDLRLATQATTLAPVEAQAATLSTRIAAGRLTGVQLQSELSQLHAAATAALASAPAARAPATAPGSSPQATAAAATAAIGRLPILLQLSCCDLMHLQPAAAPAGLMRAGTQDAGGQGTCLPSPHAAYRGLENQLYRIEVHQGGPLAQASFKWSRENGSVMTRILDASGPVLTVDSLGPDANLGFAPLQWVEITDDSEEFGQVPNQPGALLQIKQVVPEHSQIILTQPAPAVNTANGHAKLRRWDQSGSDAGPAGVAMNATGPNLLENGLVVQFAPDQPFQPGDYWLVAARTATGEPEWPPSDSDGADYQPARRVVVNRAPLACIHFDAGSQGFVVDSCRDLFAPLTALTPPPIPPALHVGAIGWTNDDVLTLDQLFIQGLTVTLDGPATSLVDAASFALHLESPISVGDSEFAASLGGGSGIGIVRFDFVVDGSVTVSGNTINWAVGRNLLSFLFQLVDGLAGQADQGIFIRARVALKGRAVSGGDPGAPIYLDGQCFGTQATRADGSQRVDLSLPSGNDEKASDFESWFYLAPIQRFDPAPTITPAAVAFIVVSDTPILLRRFTLRLVDNTSGQPDPHGNAVVPTLALSLRYSALTDTTVSLSVTGGSPGIVQVPATVTIPRGATAPANPVQLSVSNTGTTTPQTFTVTAAMTLPSGQQTSASATITVTGIVPPNPIPVPGPILTTGPTLNTILQPATPAGGGSTPTTPTTPGH
ncbi:MAG TPA: DUF6519 domain-containing protein [Acetobacteraceae bacterium]|nr:DUF6519 domain-containing protein [Acetobacteraceae bacterium]